MATETFISHEVIEGLAKLFVDEVHKQLKKPYHSEGWIPIKERELTEEEKAEMGTSCNYIFDCPLPDPGQVVLITSRYGNVTTDIFCKDDGYYFELYCEDGDVVAWMPLPDPYKEES